MSQNHAVVENKKGNAYLRNQSRNFLARTRSSSVGSNIYGSSSRVCGKVRHGKRELIRTFVVFSFWCIGLCLSFK